MTWGVITDLQPGVVYALRVMANSGAGGGKKSPTIFFTLGKKRFMNAVTNSYDLLFSLYEIRNH